MRQKSWERHRRQQKPIGFGHQIRTYVLDPYQKVTDHRTGHTTANVQAVLDGDISAFIKAYLLRERI